MKNYFSLYLKYKIKYLKLKQLGGSNFVNEFPLKKTDSLNSISTTDSISSLLTQMLEEEKKNVEEEIIEPIKLENLEEYLEEAKELIFTIAQDLIVKDSNYKSGKITGVTLLEYKNCVTYFFTKLIEEIFQYAEDLTNYHLDTKFLAVTPSLVKTEYESPYGLPIVKDFINDCKINLIDNKLSKFVDNKGNRVIKNYIGKNGEVEINWDKTYHQFRWDISRAKDFFESEGFYNFDKSIKYLESLLSSKYI